MQSFDDVSAFTHTAKSRFQVAGQAPLPWQDFLGQAETLQLLQPAGPKGLAETVLVATGSDRAVGLSFPEEAAVEASEALLFDFNAQAGLDFVIGAGAKVQDDVFRSALAHPAAQILAGYDEILALVVLASEYDMGVRMAGIVVVNCYPFELGAEILFHLTHQPPGQGLQVPVLNRILRGHDEAELVAVTIASIEKTRSFNAILLGGVERTWLPFSCNAIALQISQVGLCAA
jgi:hypothetical protein